MKKNMRTTVVSGLLLAVLTLFFLFPVYMALLNSFKSQPEMYKSVLGLPETLRLQNYEHVLNKVKVLNNFKNTFIITSLSVLGIILCSSIAGYKLSRVPGKLSNLIFLFFVASMLVPFYTIMFPIIGITKAIGLRDTILVLPLIYIGLGVNFAVFLYHGFVKGIPKEIEDAAAIDGCNQLQTFYLVVFPLLTPITMTIAILDMLWIWNDFLLPLVIINKYKNYTLVLAANSFFGQYTTEWPYILSILMLSSVPVIIFYLLFQKYIVTGISDGAIKG